MFVKKSLMRLEKKTYTKEQSRRRRRKVL